MSQEVATENETVFNDLDDDEDGQINLPQLYTFLTRQGLNITSEDEARVTLLAHVVVTQTRFLL